MVSRVSVPAPAVVLQRCRTALWDEIQAIKKKGTKPLLLADGHLIGAQDGGCLYAFTLDAEIILPDDAPGRIEVGAVSATATLVSITGLTILLLVDQSIGRQVPSARLYTDPSFLLEKLRERLQAISLDAGACARSARLLGGAPGGPVRTRPPGTPRSAAAGADLNACQRDAVERVASSEVAFIWGPPGTGKTTTLGHAVAALLAQGESVLVVAHSNAAVDQAAIAIGRRVDGTPAYREGRIMRVGVARAPGMAAHGAMQPREIVRREHPDLVREIETLERERDRLTEQLTRLSERELAPARASLDTVRKQLDERRGLLRSLERRLIGRASIILCTLSKAAIEEEIFSRTFDVAIVDEASMAYIPADLFIASLAAKRVAVFGDFRQLPPITQGDTPAIQEWLQPDIFEMAGIVAAVDGGRPDARMTMLEEQYRMHPEIAAIVKRRFYANRLTTAAGVAEACTPITDAPPQAGRAVILLDTGPLRPLACKESAGRNGSVRRSGGNSRFNLVSALVDVELALTARAGSAHTVGIITPYAAQARLVSKLLHDLKVPRDEILCATVHRFQGSECDVIIYDVVEGKPLSRAGQLLSDDTRGLAGRLLNVAVSRAKGKLIIVGDIAHLRAALSVHNVYLRVLADVQKRTGLTRPAPRTTLGCGLARAAPLPGVERFPLTAPDTAAAVGQRVAGDLQHAEIVSIEGRPRRDSTLAAALQSSSLPDAAHIHVAVSAAAASPLPTHEPAWEGSEVPCLVASIDRRVLWIEMDGYALRIEMPQAVKLLYGFWDLEPEGVRAIKTTEQQRDLAARGQSPLGWSCPKCGSPQSATLNAYDRPAILCLSPACQHESQFSPSRATQWADFTRHVCPECGGHLVGVVGTWGVYLRCARHPACRGRRQLKEIV